MDTLLLGMAGFALYLVYDLNSFTLRNRLLHGGFALGTLLIAAATAVDIVRSVRAGATEHWLLLIPAALAFGALIYCLFFALPFEETYTGPEEVRHAYTGGAYALCRHPGILCFFATYLLLGLALRPGPLLAHGMVFSLLNLLYAWFQDRVTFPKMFDDYGDYRKKVPFLIPNSASIQRAGATWPGRSRREV